MHARKSRKPDGTLHRTLLPVEMCNAISNCRCPSLSSVVLAKLDVTAESVGLLEIVECCEIAQNQHHFKVAL